MSCCSSGKYKRGAYQERLGISSHYSTIVLVFVAPSQELAVDLLGVGADVVIPDFRDAEALLNCVLAK